MNKNEKRFETIYEQSATGNFISILRDTETGVNYLFRTSGYSGGMTVLLDKDGKPVITNE